MNPISTETIQTLVIDIRGERALLDRDVASIYGVATRDINKAVLNNPDKFPENYVIKLSKSEKQELVEKFHRFEPLKHSTAIPKAFPERGLYMLATILKSAKATQATFAIIETFPLSSFIFQLSSFRFHPFLPPKQRTTNRFARTPNTPKALPLSRFKFDSRSPERVAPPGQSSRLPARAVPTATCSTFRFFFPRPSPLD